ncbi:hypothetical protein UB45_11255 [Terrabacter sp. 28]|jgi:hypothetical protein|nr:hypothetical protein UB45_11255 [Terrabacter sp. 28]
MNAIRRTTALAASAVAAAVATVVLAAPGADAASYMDPVLGTSASVGSSAPGRIASLSAGRRAAAGLQAKTMLHNEIRLAENAVRDL